MQDWMLDDDHGLVLHEDDPVGFIVLPGTLTDDWLNIRQRQNLANRDLRFIPFENEHTVWPQHPECL